VNSEGLLRIHLALECTGIDSEGRLVRIPGPDPDDIHRLLVVQHQAGCFAYPRADLPAGVRSRLTAVPPETAMRDISLVKGLLAEHGACKEVARWKAYALLETLSPGDYPDVVMLEAESHALVERFDSGFAALLEKWPVFAVLVDGKVVSACVSAREDHAAAEAWVQTAPDFRRRGYGRQTAAAWALHLRQQHKIPFYSHALDNLASDGLARSLAGSPYVTATAYA
jgi:hypothetical protein